LPSDARLATSDRPVNVLLVDDRPDKLLALESVLADGDHRVVTARSGEEALRALLHEEFAVILLDVHMPRLDGFETATLIRNRPSTEKVPIIFMTAIGDVGAGLSRGYALGAVDYIQLPVQPQVLKAKVAVFVDLYRKRELVREQGEKRLLREAEEQSHRFELLRAQQAREAAERENQVKDQFLATLSHELRAPLTPILGWTSMLRSGQVPKESVGHALEVIERNARMQSRLIEDLLDVSRIISGKLRAEKKALDLRAVVEKGIETVQSLADERKIRVEVRLADSPVRVAGDVGRLQQVVWNLASNAVKFGHEGGRVEVEVQGSASEARLVVRDDGAGIGPEFLPHVFERFSQASSGSTRLHGGLGLGLTIVRHIVEAHGGMVRAESAGPGLGATFTVTLPGLTEAPGPQAVAAPAQVRSLGPALRARRILVVDDEPDVRDLVAHILRTEGAHVVPAASVNDAVAAFEAALPDIVVTDIGMSEADGYELMSRLRGRCSAEGREIPIVALTAYASPDDAARMKAAGFAAHLAKPVEPETVIAALAAALGPR